MKTLIISLIAVLGIVSCAVFITRIIGKLKQPVKVKAEILETIFEVVYFGVLTGVLMWFLLKCPN